MADTSIDRPGDHDGRGAARAVRPWRLYEVTTRWSDERTYVETVSAPSRAAARYQRYLDAHDAFPDLTFGQFQRVSSVRLAAGAPDPDAYAHIRRFYGLDFAHGDRVSTRNEGADIEGRHGTVVYPNGSALYVNVVIDGEDHTSLFHPGSLVKLAPTPTGEDGAVPHLTTEPTR